MKRSIFQVVLMILVSALAQAKPNAQGLIEAAGRADLAGVKKLSQKVSVNAKNEFGETALIAASQSGHIEVVKFLLAKKAKVNDVDKAGNSALFYATTEAQDEVAIKLINSGASLEKTYGESKENIFLVAAKKGRAKIIEALLKKNKKLVNQKNKDAENGVFLAIRNYHFNLAQELIAKGVSAKGKNRKGQTVLDVAREAQLDPKHALNAILKKAQ